MQTIVHSILKRLVRIVRHFIYLSFLTCTECRDFSDIYQSYERAKKQKLEVVDETMPYYLERLDAQVKKNGGYFVGLTLSLVSWIT